MVGLTNIEQGMQLGQSILDNSPKYQEMKKAQKQSEYLRSVDELAQISAMTGGAEGMISVYKNLNPEKALNLQKLNEEVNTKLLANKQADVNLVQDISTTLGAMAPRLAAIKDPVKRQQVFEEGVKPLADRFDYKLPDKVDQAMPELDMMYMSNITPSQQELLKAPQSAEGKKLQDIQNLMKEGKVELANQAMGMMQKANEYKTKLNAKEIVEALDRDNKDYKAQKDQFDLVAIGLNDPRLQNSAWASENVGVPLARALGEKGPLTEPDMKRVLGQQLPQRLTNYLNDIIGKREAKLSQGVLEDMKTYSNEILKLVEDKMDTHNRQAFIRASSIGADFSMINKAYYDKLSTRLENNKDYQEDLQAALKKYPNLANDPAGMKQFKDSQITLRFLNE